MTLAVSHLDLPTLFFSGQCFRMHPMENGAFLVLSGEQALRVTPLGGGRFRFSCAPSRWPYWQRYFDLETDYDALLSAIPPEETYLRQAAQACDGLRILRQEPFETLISFILSQRKSIPAIRGCVEALCQRFGRALPCGASGFPSPRRLARATEEELRACGLGYRAPYVLASARMVARGEVDLRACAQLDDPALLETLMTFPGVGVKVASCVMLFAYHRMAAAPVDVWIQKVIDEVYGGTSPFPRWGQVAGWYQQMLFYYRQHVLREKTPSVFSSDASLPKGRTTSA